MKFTYSVGNEGSNVRLRGGSGRTGVLMGYSCVVQSDELNLVVVRHKTSKVLFMLESS